MNDINFLSAQVLKELEKLNYSAARTLNFQQAFRNIRKWFNENAGGVYSDETCEEYLDSLEKLRDEGHDKGWINTKIRCAEQLKSYYHTGDINLNYDRCRRKDTYIPSEHALKTIDKILDGSQLGERTKITRSTYLRKFFCFIEEQGLDETGVTPEIIAAFIEKSHKETPSSMNWVCCSLKMLMRHLVEEGIFPYELDLKFLTPKSPGRRFLPCYSEDEVKQILESVDRDTPVGKRNYAILLLGISTGLRAKDIEMLKLTDIDWKKQEISIVQSKTQQGILLPVSGQCCNALADYILHGRPESQSEYVFLRSRAPFTQFLGTVPCLNTIIDRQSSIAGVEKKSGRAFHSLRRTFGTWLASEEIPLPMISQLMGHTDMESGKPYLSFQDTAVSMCAMGFGDIPVKGGVYHD